jgi:hypothetical protein
VSSTGASTGDRTRSPVPAVPPAEDPTLAALIEAVDPEVRAAIDDVDRTLIALSLARQPALGTMATGGATIDDQSQLARSSIAK